MSGNSELSIPPVQARNLFDNCAKEGRLRIRHAFSPCVRNTQGL